MVKFVSPGAYVIEKDISQYTPTTGGTIVGIVGFAGKGPVDTPTLITSQDQLVQTFGEPSEDIPGQALEGALEILETTNQIYFIRAAEEDSATDASAIPVVGTCPTVYVSGVPATTNDSGTALRVGSFGIGRDLYLHVQVYNESGTPQYATPRDFDVPAGTKTNTFGNEQAHALKQVIGGELDDDQVSVSFDPNTSSVCAGFIYSKYAGSGAYMDIAAFTTAARTVGLNCLQAVGNTGNYEADGANGANTSGLYTSALRVYGYQYNSSLPDASSIGYLGQSIHAGAGYNQTTDALGVTTGNSITITANGGLDNLLTVNDGGVAAENFAVSLYAASGAAPFIEAVINTDEGETTTLTSDIIKGYLTSGNVGADLAVTAMTQTCATIPALGWDPADHYGVDVLDIVGNAELPVSSASYPGDTLTGGFHYFTGTPATATGLDPQLGMFNNKISTLTQSHTTTWETTTPLASFKYNSKASHFTPPHIKFVQGTTLMAGGDNGTGTTEDGRATALIGKVDPSSTTKTGMQSLSNEDLGISIALVPGIQTQSVQNNLVTLAETTQNFLALLSCPEGIGGASQAISFANGLGSGRTAALNSSYAAIYYPHLKVFSTYDGKDRFYDPAIYAARQMGLTDSDAEAWFAPAGATRGRLTKPSDTEVSLSQGDRDAMYSGGNVVNPIVKFPKDGIMIFGQRTTQRAPTALDRVNVRRLMIEIRRSLLATSRQFVFEPNDEFTYAHIQSTLDSAMDDYKRRRGIIEFKVICDETTNTSARVDRNELWCKVLIKPTKTAEILVFEVNLTNQSAKLSN